MYPCKRKTSVSEADICFSCTDNEQTSEEFGRRARQRVFASDRRAGDTSVSEADICFSCTDNEQTSEEFERKARQRVFASNRRAKIRRAKSEDKTEVENEG